MRFRGEGEKRRQPGRLDGQSSSAGALRSHGPILNPPPSSTAGGLGHVVPLFELRFSHLQSAVGNRTELTG